MHDSKSALVLALHRQRFGEPAAMFAAPGRANLIGEHTDYSEGFVMPAAIDFSTVAAISPRDDSRAVMYSANFDDLVEHSIAHVTAGRRDHWTDYPAGVLWSLEQEGLRFPGFNLTVAGDVPVGAGLSSSASIEVAVAMALLALSNQQLDLKRLAQICQRAENGFVGANSGIMDQLVVCCGKADHAMMLDCRTLDFKLVEIPSHVRIVLCNSMVKHSISGGEYNTRRAEIEEGVKILQRQNPSIKFLRDATMDDLLAHKAEMPDNVFRRCRHVITENQRVLDGAAAFESGDLKHFGQLMKQSHDSYRNDFEASCEECDILVELAQKLPGCYGARLTGGGFGGCTVNLVEDTDADAFVEAMRDGYKRAAGITAEIYLTKASDGVHPVIF
ncbi:MAG TPA: galactokinase [Acidobacteriaceae bacterium]|nr:galactokinase [Acidobacteriaceae bacterium]